MPKEFQLSSRPLSRSDPPIASDNDGPNIDSRSLVLKLLKRTFDLHCLLNVTLDDAESSYSSIILEPGADNDYVLLDELTPADGMSPLRVDTAVSISTLLDGLQLAFTSRVVEPRTGEHPPGISIAIPEQVYYAQHRREHRVRVPMNWSISVSIILNNHHRIDAIVRDLSPRGFSARLDAPLPGPVEALDSPLKFSLTLGANPAIEGEMEICYVATPEFRKFQMIGTRILTISPQGQRLIEQCVAEIDSQQCRLS